MSCSASILPPSVEATERVRNIAASIHDLMTCPTDSRLAPCVEALFRALECELNPIAYVSGPPNE